MVRSTRAQKIETKPRPKRFFRFMELLRRNVSAKPNFGRPAVAICCWGRHRLKRDLGLSQTACWQAFRSSASRFIEAFDQIKNPVSLLQLLFRTQHFLASVKNRRAYADFNSCFDYMSRVNPNF